MGSNFCNYVGKCSVNSMPTIASWCSPMWFTSVRTLTSHIVTNIISSTLTTWSTTITAVVMRGTDYQKKTSISMLNEVRESMINNKYTKTKH